MSTLAKQLTATERRRVIDWLRELRHPWTERRLAQALDGWERAEQMRKGRTHRPACPVQK